MIFILIVCDKMFLPNISRNNTSLLLLWHVHNFFIGIQFISKFHTRVKIIIVSFILIMYLVKW